LAALREARARIAKEYEKQKVEELRLEREKKLRDLEQGNQHQRRERKYSSDSIEKEYQ